MPIEVNLESEADLFLPIRHGTILGHDPLPYKGDAGDVDVNPGLFKDLSDGALRQALLRFETASRRAPVRSRLLRWMQRDSRIQLGRVIVAYNTSGFASFGWRVTPPLHIRLIDAQ